MKYAIVFLIALFLVLPCYADVVFSPKQNLTMVAYSAGIGETPAAVQSDNGNGLVSFLMGVISPTPKPTASVEDQTIYIIYNNTSTSDEVAL